MAHQIEDTLIKDKSILELLVFLKLKIEQYWGTEIRLIHGQIVPIDGLCLYMHFLYNFYYINEIEYKTLINLFNKYKPPSLVNGYWWPRGELKPRQKFLNMLIRKQVPKGNPLLHLKCAISGKQLTSWNNIVIMYPPNVKSFALLHIKSFKHKQYE